MNGQEKSDPAIVAVKPANKDAEASAEPVEPRAGAEGNAVEHGMRRTPSRESMSHGLDSVRQAESTLRRQIPKVGARCGKAARRDLCGGRAAMHVPTAMIVQGKERNAGGESDHAACPRDIALSI